MDLYTASIAKATANEKIPHPGAGLAREGACLCPGLAAAEGETSGSVSTESRKSEAPGDRGLACRQSAVAVGHDVSLQSGSGPRQSQVPGFSHPHLVALVGLSHRTFRTPVADLLGEARNPDGRSYILLRVTPRSPISRGWSKRSTPTVLSRSTRSGLTGLLTISPTSPWKVMEPGGKYDSTVTENGFVLRRLGPEAWLAEMPASMEDGADDLTDTFGEQAEWGFAIPAMFRVLAPRRRGLPPSPRAGRSDVVLVRVLVIAAPHDAVLNGMVPPRPRIVVVVRERQAHGGSTRLQLLSEVFDSDGQLDWFAAWLWTVRFNDRVQLRLWTNSQRGWIQAERR